MNDEGRRPPLLIILGGPPGTGKTSLARVLSGQLGGLHLRIDSIEQALRASEPAIEVYDHGYRVAYAIAEDNLRLQHTVIADSVNSVADTRNAWRQVAKTVAASFIEVEVVCTDQREHRRRIETRMTEIEGLRLPTWEDVLRREYEPWTSNHMVLNTANLTPEQGARVIQEAIEQQ